ncbi:MAG: hypothetical protein JNK29_01340 [Anaerolineales bacterium]|nr:hypothetical protein [Anaerolineales bacterium]
MSVRIDSKGKIFTDVVHKEEVPVLIQTLTNVIHGNIFLRPEQRIKDSLNDNPESFIAVTGAQIYSPAGQLLHTAEFLTVNKQHIVWLRPDDKRPAHPAESVPGA